MRRAQGFSLMELVIIILVVAILSVYSFYTLPSNTLNMDAQIRQLSDDIRYTQSLSMSRDERYYILQTSTTSYQILNSAGVPIMLANGGATMTLNAGLSFGTWGNLTNNLIAFDGRGTPYLSTGVSGTALSGGTTYSISIIGSGNSKVITISPITGAVQPQ